MSAETSLGKYPPPPTKVVKEAWMQGFKTCKLLVLNELTTYGVSQELLDKVADLEEA